MAFSNYDKNKKGHHGKINFGFRQRFTEALQHRVAGHRADPQAKCWHGPIRSHMLLKISHITSCDIILHLIKQTTKLKESKSLVPRHNITQEHINMLTLKNP